MEFHIFSPKAGKRLIILINGRWAPTMWVEWLRWGRDKNRRRQKSIIAYRRPVGGAVTAGPSGEVHYRNLWDQRLVMKLIVSALHWEARNLYLGDENVCERKAIKRTIVNSPNQIRNFSLRNFPQSSLKTGRSNCKFEEKIVKARKRECQEGTLAANLQISWTCSTWRLCSTKFESTPSTPLELSLLLSLKKHQFRKLNPFE